MQSHRTESLGLPRRRFLALAGAALTGTLFLPSGTVVRAGPGAAPGDPVQQRLSNGLLVIVQERPTAETVALEFANLAGARDDGGLPGVTVLTSRLLMQGTPRRPSEIEIQRVVTLVGGTISRGTTSELSYIQAVVPSTETDIAFDLLADVVGNPLFTPATVTGQLQQALQEQAQRQRNPSVLIGDLFIASLFAGQPLGSPVLGTPDSIQAITMDALQANHERLWGAANSVLTVAGRIRQEDALASAQRYFGGLAGGTANQRQPTQPQAPAAPQTVRGSAGQQVQFRVGFSAPSLRDADRYPMAVLDGMMSGFSGRLLRELRTRRGIAYTPFTSFSAFSDAGAWFASAGVDPENLSEALDVTRTEIQLLRDTEAPQSEVSDAIDTIAGGQILATESNLSVASQLAVRAILGDVSTEELVRRVRAVTPADVQRVARTYLDLDHQLTVLVGPGSS